MDLPPEVREMVQIYLGQDALAIQKTEGRGAWIITDKDGGQGAYVPVDKLPQIYGGGSKADFDSLLEMVKAFDPTKEVVCVFNAKDDLQFIGVIGIDEPLP